MKFEQLDKKMRVFETAHDHCVLPEIYMVVRLDGRNFTRYTKEVWNLEAPFDVRFRDAMIHTTTHLMTCGFNAAYGYTQSDEISLLLQRDDATFGRKTRKLISVFAGEASAAFSMHMQQIACFDARVSQLPTAELVEDYFAWRQEDAHRNSLNAHCYWLLRKQGQSVQAATSYLIGRSTMDKNELQFQNGINFNDLPAWQKRGVGVYWQEYAKQAINPLTQEVVSTTRRKVEADLELKLGEEYQAFIRGFV